MCNNVRIYVCVCVCLCVYVCVCLERGGQEDVQQHLLNSLPRPSPGSIFTQISSPSSSKSSSPALFRRQDFVRAQSELISPFLGVTEPAPASADSSHCELHIYFHKSLSTLTNSISVHNFSISTKNVHILVSVFDCN